MSEVSLHGVRIFTIHNIVGSPLKWKLDYRTLSHIVSIYMDDVITETTHFQENRRIISKHYI